MLIKEAEEEAAKEREIEEAAKVPETAMPRLVGNSSCATSIPNLNFQTRAQNLLSGSRSVGAQAETAGCNHRRKPV